jgi:hypothetical protein
VSRGLLIVALVLAILSALLFVLGENFGHPTLAGAFAAYVGSHL